MKFWHINLIKKKKTVVLEKYDNYLQNFTASLIFQQCFFIFNHHPLIKIRSTAKQTNLFTFFIETGVVVFSVACELRIILKTGS